jgi:ATP-dependent RNA helicase DHX8/PRP22
VAVPLYAALSPEDQLKAFEPATDGARRVIVATNIAETSITIPGIRVVIDCGLIKEREFRAARRTAALEVHPTSQASARQRAGRAGREAKGECFHLYPLSAFHHLPRETRPEILRSSLDAVFLQLFALGVSDPVGFDFVTPPPDAPRRLALESLLRLGLIGPGRSTSDPGSIGLGITPLGELAVRFPTEPGDAVAILVAALAGDCLAEMLTLISMLTAETPFVTPRGKEAEARAQHNAHMSQYGDHATLVSVFNAFASTPARQRKEWCRDRFFQRRALDNAARIREQLAQICIDLQLPGASAAMAVSARPDAASASIDAAAVTESTLVSLAAGHPNAVARSLPGVPGAFSSRAGLEAVPHPSSCLRAFRPWGGNKAHHLPAPAAALTHEFVELNGPAQGGAEGGATSRCYMRTVSVLLDAERPAHLLRTAVVELSKRQPPSGQ